ncbi:multicopper oxidase [Stipitochalara longipes BDJ]|nr:multicopper oxidase [Stipitochalara longipes BDJ]
MLFLQTLLSLLSASAGLIEVAYAATVVHDKSFIPDAVLNITSGLEKQSCVPLKEILLVNGTSPGPELRFTEGKTVWIRVYNNIADQNLTIHWHGLSMAVAPFSDGTPSASQWPIPPLHFFDYELSVPKGMAGTYFYHSHVGLQALSCTGPLIIVEADQPPYHYEGERIIFTQDVFVQNDSTIVAGLEHTPLIYAGDQAMVLINGKGAGSSNDGAVVCNEALSVINVEPGKSYRLRFIGGTGLSYDIIAIEGHNTLELIEADGSYTDKFNVSFIQIAPGQRYSAILHTLSKPGKDQYFIQLETRDHGNITRSYAVLNYGPSTDDYHRSFYPPISPPLSLPDTDESWTEYQLHPHHSDTYSADECPTAEEVTRRVNITVHLSEPGGRLVYLLDGYPWFEDTPEEPYLVSLYKGDGLEYPSMVRALNNSGLDPVSRAFVADLGEVLEIVIQNTGSDGGEMETHPWHAHGAHYWDLGSGGGIYNRDANEAKWAISPGKPVKRDTTMLYRNKIFAEPNELSGWRAWRLKITEPGVWMVHCHILPHMVFGMQTVWVMGNSSEVLGQVPRPDVEGYLTYGGSVNGNATHDPEVVEYYPNWTTSQ